MNRLALANKLFRSGDLERAEALYRQLLEDEPDNPKPYRPLIQLYAQKNEPGPQVELLHRALTLEPRAVDLNLNLARLYAQQEKFDAAERHYRQVLDAEPEHIGALIALAKLGPQEVRHELVAVMERLYAGSDLAVADRRRLAFTLGKIRDDLGEYDRAFEFFAAGNAIARQSVRVESESEQARYEATRNIFPADFFARHPGSGHADAGIIFIIGLPRSGTSLVEQILASHPDVHGAGETALVPGIVASLARLGGQPFPAFVPSLDDAALQALGLRLAEELRKRAAGARFVTDKTLGNEPYVGLIHAILPHARIIHCSRDPRDQGLSFFQRDFGDQQPFSHALEDIGHYTNRTRRIMEHWSRVLPGRFLSIRYEEIVADLETNVRRMLEYCDLSWDPACLDFHATERVVGTASNRQVRQPVFSSSVGRWRPYSRQLQPLIDVLDD